MPNPVPIEPLIKLAKEAALAQGLDPGLICCICEQESGWNPYAIRYEPAFMSRYVAPLYTTNKITATEAFARCFSWSLMQVMGQVARETGWTGPLAQLCDPPVGLLIGCRVFAKKLTLAKGDLTKSLLLWNGGSNLAYPSQVLGRLPKYR